MLTHYGSGTRPERARCGHRRLSPGLGSRQGLRNIYAAIDAASIVADTRRLLSQIIRQDFSGTLSEVRATWYR
jgi:hypothetical protein